MATNFPSSIDNFTNPTTSDTLASVSHSAQHADVNDAVEAIETALLDGAPLHVDSTNSRVGIGTTSPTQALQVEGRIVANYAGNAFPLSVQSDQATSGIILSDGGTTSNVVLRSKGDDFQIRTNANDRVTVDSSGNVGIGTTTPAAPLHVSSTAGEGVRIQKSNNDQQGSYIGMWDDNERIGYIGYAGDDDLYLENEASAGKTFLSTNGSVRLTVDSSGNVGINDTTPSYTLDVAGDINATGDVRVAGNPVGMVLVKTQAIGSGVSSVTVTNAFSATFENYLITLAGGSSTVSGILGLRLGSTTSAYYGSFIYALTGGGSPAQVNDSNAARFTHIASAGGSFLSAQINIHMPFTATQTTVSSQGVTYGTVNGTYNGVLATSTSYSSFVFVCGSGTMTGGTIRVYGYNNG